MAWVGRGHGLCRANGSTARARCLSRSTRSGRGWCASNRSRIPIGRRVRGWPRSSAEQRVDARRGHLRRWPTAFCCPTSVVDVAVAAPGTGLALESPHALCDPVERRSDARRSRGLASRSWRQRARAGAPWTRAAVLGVARADAAVLSRRRSSSGAVAARAPRAARRRDRRARRDPASPPARCSGWRSSPLIGPRARRAARAAAERAVPRRRSSGWRSTLLERRRVGPPRAPSAIAQRRDARRGRDRLRFSRRRQPPCCSGLYERLLQIDRRSVVVRSAALLAASARSRPARAWRSVWSCFMRPSSGWPRPSCARRRICWRTAALVPAHRRSQRRRGGVASPWSCSLHSIGARADSSRPAPRSPSAAALLAAAVLSRPRGPVRRASQAARLGLLFLALLLPAIAMYPSIDAFATASREQTIASDFAPQVAQPARGSQAGAPAARARGDRRDAVARRVRHEFVGGRRRRRPTARSSSGRKPSSPPTARRRPSSCTGRTAGWSAASRLILPEYGTTNDRAGSCDEWELYEEVSPFGSSAPARAAREPRDLRRTGGGSAPSSCARCSTTARCPSSRRKVRISSRSSADTLGAVRRRGRP